MNMDQQQQVDIADTLDMQSLSLGEESEHSDADQPEATKMRLRVPGLTSFDLDLQPGLTVAELKMIAQEQCGIEPSCMRITVGGQVLKDTDTIDNSGIFDDKEGIQVLFKAGSEYLLGGGGFQPGPNNKPTKIVQGSMGRGIPGSKGLRGSRVTGRCGGMGLIRKYGIMMKRQEFREKATQMGWVKYR